MPWSIRGRGRPQEEPEEPARVVTTRRGDFIEDRGRGRQRVLTTAHETEQAARQGEREDRAREAARQLSLSDVGQRRALSLQETRLGQEENPERPAFTKVTHEPSRWNPFASREAITAREGMEGQVKSYREQRITARATRRAERTNKRLQKIAMMEAKTRRLEAKRKNKYAKLQNRYLKEDIKQSKLTTKENRINFKTLKLKARLDRLALKAELLQQKRAVAQAKEDIKNDKREAKELTREERALKRDAETLAQEKQKGRPNSRDNKGIFYNIRRRVRSSIRRTNSGLVIVRPHTARRKVRAKGIHALNIHKRP
jgi:hypothetical protein